MVSVFSTYVLVIIWINFVDDQSTKDLLYDDMELFLIDEEEFFKSVLI